ncbi:MAG: UDP-N-acetylmuramoyl-L-alanine--D-glutamate ligase [Desulforegulaceae bacterium]|nr:UDP-N-acetylmuramoyl-L-alanine--D-glutamate ligase [Desulforegulaceae bacterium]
MFSIKDFKNKKILVAGLGKSGISVLNLLHSKGFNVKGCDKNKKILESDEIKKISNQKIKIVIANNFEEEIKTSDLIILSPGIDQREEVYIKAVNQGKNVIGELEAAWSFIDKPVAAITGTNGKSTVTELTADILAHSGKKVFRGGNLGVPLSQGISDKSEFDIFVLEISSFQLDTCVNFSPQVGTILNITPDHLDRYEDFCGYKNSKLNLFKNFNKENTSIINYNESLKLETKGKKSFFNIFDPSFNSAFANKKELKISFNKKVEKISLKNFKLKGRHNLENLSAAALTALESGGSIKGIKKAIETFNPLPHRMEFLGSINNISFINDSKATNPDSVIKAVECLEGEISLILGGKDKGYNYGVMSKILNEKVKNIILIGEASKKINSQINFKRKAVFSITMEDAVKKGFENISEKGTVILSPGCSSFDMFKNYSHRGEAFKNSFLNLKNRENNKNDY